MNGGDYSNARRGDEGRVAAGGPAAVLDLRGVRCPLSWARAKVRLEVMAPGAELVLLLDDAKGARDIPRAAEAEGYVVAEVRREADLWRLVIQR